MCVSICMEGVLTRAGSQVLLSDAKLQDESQWAETETQEVFHEEHQEKLLYYAGK